MGPLRVGEGGGGVPGVVHALAPVATDKSRGSGEYWPRWRGTGGCLINQQHSGSGRSVKVGQALTCKLVTIYCYCYSTPTTNSLRNFTSHTNLI